jgi:hypothetical protein
LQLLFDARPDIAPHSDFELDLHWLALKGLLQAKPDGTFQRSAAGQRRVAAELRSDKRRMG